METDEDPRVLLLDDDRSFLQRMQCRLEAQQEDVDVLTETEPRALLDRIERRDDIDCVVGSTVFQSLSGVELLNALRARDQQVPVIALTADRDAAEGTALSEDATEGDAIDEDDVDGDAPAPSEAVEAGATKALRKPAVLEHPNRLASAVGDAVERQHSRELLREGFGFLDTMLGSLDDIVYVTDTEGQPIYWNEAATRATGYTSDEVRQLGLLGLFPEDEHDNVLAALDTVFEEGSATLETDLLTKAGERVRYEFSSTVFRNDNGDVIGICGTGRNVRRRYYYETTLRALHRTTRELFGATTRAEIATTAVDATEYIVDSPLSTVFLREDDQLVPMAATNEARQLLGEIPTYGVTEQTPAAETYLTGESALVQHAADIDDDHSRTSGWGALYVSLGEHGVLALGFRQGEPITSSHRQLAELLAANTAAALTRHAGESALERRKRMLETLHGATRELIQTSDPVAIAELLVADADEILGSSGTSVFFWNEDRGILEPVAESDGVEALFGELTAVDGRDGHIWETFVDAETTVISSEEVRDSDSAADEDAPPIQLVAPIGDHGVLLSGATDTAAFGDTAVGFAELLAANAAMALDRAEREQSLREKDRQLEQQNEELRRLNRLNAIIRTINDGLIQADSRAEILEVVCETLSDVENYRFTWIGRGPHDEDAPTPLAFAGEGRSILEHLLTPVPGESGSILERVQERDESAVVNDIHRDSRVEPWRKAALNHGFRSLVCLPLRFEEQEYGFLEIIADRPGVFTDDEVTVLTELADHIANAINAVERKEALLTGRETQLEFEFDDVADPLTRLAQRVDGTITVDGLVPHGSGAWIVYATVNGADATALTAAVEQSSTITDIDVLRSGEDTTLVSLTVSDLTVVNSLARRNATVRALHVDPEGGRATVTLTPSTDVRAFVTACRERLPSLELVRRQVAAGEEPGTRLKYDLTDLLTDKQLEALQTAYFLGYFNWPRDATGVDVAEALDVSPPTFQQHLRKSLQRIFESTFEVRE